MAFNFEIFVFKSVYDFFGHNFGNRKVEQYSFMLDNKTYASNFKLTL